jgi:hypothetical protein
MESNITAWSLISQEPRFPQGVLTDGFVQRFDRYMDWEQLSIHYLFTMAMLRIYFHRVNWIHILKRQQFSEDFLIEMSSNFNNCWEVISKYQNLSENYIDNYKDKLEWEVLFNNQRLSGKFLREHEKYLKFIHFDKDNDTNTSDESFDRINDTITSAEHLDKNNDTNTGGESFDRINDTITSAEHLDKNNDTITSGVKCGTSTITPYFYLYYFYLTSLLLIKPSLQ